MGDRLPPPITQRPETQKVYERGDRVVTLDQRLDTIEEHGAKIEARIDKLERWLIVIAAMSFLGNSVGQVIAHALGL